jgi:pectate lyase
VFRYEDQTSHRFSNLIGHSDNNAAEDAGRLHITFHHNWWSEGVQERMPRVRFGKIHCFNNYFSSAGNNYCIRAALESEVLVENNFFEDVDEPWEYYAKNGQTPGKIQAQGNEFRNVTGRIPARDTVFRAPYKYTMDTASRARSLVLDHAGAGRGYLVESD